MLLYFCPFERPQEFPLSFLNHVGMIPLIVVSERHKLSLFQVMTDYPWKVDAMNKGLGGRSPRYLRHFSVALSVHL